MRRFLGLFGIVMAGAMSAQGVKPFTLRQILSAPYALDLTAAPVGARFAWVENAEGSRNIWVGGPHEAARMVTHYSVDDAQDINGLAWSPRGKAIAYAYGAPNGADGKPANPAHLQRPTTVEVRVQSIDGDVMEFSVPGHSPIWSPSGDTLYWVNEGKIWSRYLDGDPPPPPSQGPLVVDRGSASGLTLSPDGTLLAFVSRRGGHSFIGLFDLRAKTLKFLSPGTGRDFAPIFSVDGKRVAWLRGPWTEAPEFAANRVSQYPWSVMVADVARPDVARAVYTAETGKPGSVLPHLATGGPQVFWMPDGRLAFFSEMAGWVHLYVVDANGGKPELLTPGKGEVEDATQGPGGTLMWASNVPTCTKGVCDLKDEDRRHLWKLEAGKAIAVTSGDASEVKPQVAADGTVAALMSDGTSPMHPVLVTSDGVMTTLRPGELAKDFPLDAAKTLRPLQVLIPESGVAPKSVAADDARVSLHGQLFLPPDESRNADPPTSSKDDNKKSGRSETSNRSEVRHPALIFTHGGPMREMLLGYPAMEYYSNAYAMNQYLASRGFVVLSVNYHCGIGYGTDFRQCVHAGADGASEYADVLAAAKWLRARKDVDAKRIGLWGGSYGGYLTALGLARNSDLFAAGVDFHGVHDWILEDNNADWLRGTLAEKDAIAAKAKASSPIADVAKWKSPVLLIHGDNDGNVAFNQTPMLADALRARGVHVEELIFPDEIHEFLLHKDWLKAYEAEAAFFEQVLKP